MPRGDRTGPLGIGPMTVRAAGFGAGYPVPGYMNPYAGWPEGGAPFAYRQPWGSGYSPIAPYGWGAFPAYGGLLPLRRRGGRGGGRGRGRGWWW
jgi:hypothetical protein